MKTTFTLRSASLLMAFLLMITSTGFSMNMHFCGGEFQDIALFGNDVECNMMQKIQAKPACPMHAMKAMDCCEDQDVQIEKASHETFVLKNIQLTFDWAFIPASASSLEYSPSVQEISESYTTYRPPPIDREIYILVQSFLL